VPSEGQRFGAQTLRTIREMRILCHQQYVFPAIGGGGRPLSENTINGAIRRLGHSGDEMTSHGFRSMASTLLNEQGVHPDLIELLAHAERNTVRAA
jgi:integrase